MLLANVPHVPAHLRNHLPVVTCFGLNPCHIVLFLSEMRELKSGDKVSTASRRQGQSSALNHSLCSLRKGAIYHQCWHDIQKHSGTPQTPSFPSTRIHDLKRHHKKSFQPQNRKTRGQLPTDHVSGYGCIFDSVFHLPICLGKESDYVLEPWVGPERHNGSHMCPFKIF